MQSQAEGINDETLNSLTVDKLGEGDINKKDMERMDI